VLRQVLGVDALVEVCQQKKKKKKRFRYGGLGVEGLGCLCAGMRGEG